MSICAILPARNEEDRVAETVRAVRSRKEIDRVVVIDDASSDRTAEAARAAGADDVMRLDTRRGKGGALEEGLRIARDADIVLFLDADLGPSAAECSKLIAALQRGRADMAIGVLPPDRSISSAGSAGSGLGIVVTLARRVLLRRTGRQFQQPLSGQRAIRREVLERRGGRLPRGFGVEVGLTLSALRDGFEVVEVETMFRHRVTGADWKSVLHRGRQLMDVAVALRE